MPILKGNRDQGGYVRITQYPYFLREGCTAKNDDQIMKMTLFPGSGIEIVQGVLDVEIDRTSGYPFTSALWGGAEDIAVRCSAYNRAANGAYGGIKAMRIYARQYAGGQLANMYGLECSWDDRGSGGSASISSAAYAALFSTRPNGVVSASAEIHTVVIEDTGQGLVSPTAGTNNSLLHFRTAGGAARASGAVPACMSFEKGSGSSGWTNLMSFKAADGSEAFKAVSGGAHQGNVDGYIQIYDETTGQALYLLCYDTVPS